MEGLYSAIQENTVPTLSPQHHQKEELGGDCVLLGLLSAECLSVFWDMQHFPIASKYPAALT